jgi:two-component system sensor histidine kinase AgrC
MEEISSQYKNGEEAASIDGISHIRDEGLKYLFIFKYTECNRRHIDFSLFIDEAFNPDIPHTTLIELLGILLDNAIEAAGEADKMVVLVRLESTDGYSIKVLNTFAFKPDLQHIFNDGYSTKAGHSGYGLNRLHQILRKHKQISYSVDTADGWFIFKLMM